MHPLGVSSLLESLVLQELLQGKLAPFAASSIELGTQKVKRKMQVQAPPSLEPLF